MFTIGIRLAQQCDLRDIRGLEALDERRRLGLPDDSRLIVPDRGESMGVEVSEQFARAYFCRRDVETVERDVPLRICCPGDIEDIGCGEVRFSVSLPPERVRELWLAAGHSQQGQWQARY